ncbi:DUF3221 domain-containing protein [Sporosarcina aquimarina]|uniref:DUF3221 domain-containing protein n=1 Tax=Sporosarcina aquimarina TaxID=114975 RepID=A0ABU4FYJ0_9BACL|nr:DUF3221 domain-containing protein [Sporosarcina aquimarina]MDW0109789.1 DUF3221 domain-containing protein [Sporosarcina aquimarina]
MKKRIFIAVLSSALLTGGCGTEKTNQTPAGDSTEQRDKQVIKTIDGREIIAELKQTVEESPKRDSAAEEQLLSTEYKEGYLGDPSKELEEDIAVQAIEGPAAIEAIQEVYGGDEGFNNEGVLFFENQASEGNRSGIWIGLKNPDVRLKKVLDILQEKVDAGEILAEPIYFYHSPHTQQDLRVQQDKVAKAVSQLQEGRGSYSVSINTITGIIEIGHDFLNAEEIQQLEKQFSKSKLQFNQEGSLVAEPGQSALTMPNEKETQTPMEDGGFVLAASDEGFLVAGGTEGAVSYSFAEADQLTVGMRVKVEATGGIAESYPGQGNAKFVEVLPDYHPAGAVLSESQVVQKAIQKNTSDFIVIVKVSYNPKNNVWSLTLNDESVVEIEDQ